MCGSHTFLVGHTHILVKCEIAPLVCFLNSVKNTPQFLQCTHSLITFFLKEKDAINSEIYVRLIRGYSNDFIPFQTGYQDILCHVAKTNVDCDTFHAHILYDALCTRCLHSDIAVACVVILLLRPTVKYFVT